MDLHYQNLFSTTTGSAPSLDKLLRGELAINLFDGKMFYRKVTDAAQESTDTIESFSILSTLASLKDVKLATPAQGQALVYNTTAAAWENVTLTSDHISNFLEKTKEIVNGMLGSDVGFVYRKADGTLAEIVASGEQNVTVATDADAKTLKIGLGNVGTAGTYFKVTTDDQGRVTAGENPTTLAGFGITDGVNKHGDTVDGLIKLTGVAESDFTDDSFVTKKYADSVALGFVFHVACKAGAVKNIDGVYAAGSNPSYPGVGATFTASVTEIGGVTLQQGDRVLLVAQTDAKQNGAYAVTTVGSGQVVLTRADDLDGEPTISYKGASFLVAEGTSKGTVWRLANEGGITFGTDALEFVQIFAPTTYSAGNGIDITSNTVSVVTDSTLKFVGNKLAVVADNYATLDGTNNVFTVTPKSTAAQDKDTAEDAELAKIGTVKSIAQATAEGLTYTDESDTGATIEVGGIAAGEKLTNINFPDFVEKLLHKPYGPSGLTLNLAPTNGGTFEFGNNQTITSATVAWSKNGTSNVVSAELLNGSTSIKTVAHASKSGPVTITPDSAVTISTTSTINAKVTDTNGFTAQASKTFTFVYPSYFGAVSTSTPDAATIQGFAKNLYTKGARTIAFTTTSSQRCMYAFPAAYGNITKILDQNNFDVTSTFVKSTVSITGLDGTAQTYNVYVNDAAELSGFKFTFSF